jgi:hypothetical protein
MVAGIVPGLARRGEHDNGNPRILEQNMALALI